MNSFGRLFRVQIFGESHQRAVGVLVDGCPPGIPLTPELFENQLARRAPGAEGTTARKESDEVGFQSGVFEGKTTGAPILLSFENRTARPSDYDSLKSWPRPGHADYTAMKRYGGHNDPRGGGHFSGRLTVGIVAAGVIANQLLKGVSINAEVVEVGGENPWGQRLKEAQERGDSLGGVIRCQVSGLPIGLGEPFFDSVESLLSHALFAIPGVKGISFGSGFDAPRMWGSEHNDSIAGREGATATNNAGGINGGLTNGNPLLFHLALRPTASIAKPQHSMDFEKGELVRKTIPGRHDVAFVLRVPPVVEAMTALVLADLTLLHRAP